MNIKKITYGGLLIAIAVLLPQAFHLTGVAQAGKVFLPMHIPVLLSGFVLGPLFGLFIGVVSPLISCLVTGMPDTQRVLFMVMELAGYGFVSGLFYETLGFRKRRFGIYITLVSAMISGRLIYGAMLFVAGTVLGMEEFGFYAMLGAIVTGAWGIVIQLVFLPSVVFGLERSGNLERLVGKSKKPAA